MLALTPPLAQAMELPLPQKFVQEQPLKLALELVVQVLLLVAQEEQKSAGHKTGK